MFEQVQQIIEEVSQLSEDERGTVVTMLVLVLIRDVVYYLVAGIVVLILGKRMIQAGLFAWRESHRETEDRTHEAERS